VVVVRRIPGELEHLKLKGWWNKLYDINLTGYISRRKIEYETENVPFLLFILLGKAEIGIDTPPGTNYRDNWFTVDYFTDKALSCIQQCGNVAGDPRGILVLRHDKDTYYHYRSLMDARKSTQDFIIQKYANGMWSIVASEAVDLVGESQYTITFSIAGSTIKAWRQTGRDLSESPTLSATDTSIASGRMGGRNEVFFAEVLPAQTRLKPALYIIETDLTGSGSEDDPFRPKLAESIVNNKNEYAITYGLFDFSSDKHNTMIVVITDGVSDNAILKQLEIAKRKFKAVSSYQDAIDLYNTLKRDYEFIAGKDNFAYQVIGDDRLELLAIADFYFGNIVEKLNPDMLKNVPDFEVRRLLDRYESRLEKIESLNGERDKHLNKLKEVKKIGW